MQGGGGEFQHSYCKAGMMKSKLGEWKIVKSPSSTLFSVENEIWEIGEL